MSASFNPASRRSARPTLLCRCVQAGVVACGLAGGLVEFLALQRWRVQLRQRVAPPPWWR